MNKEYTIHKQLRYYFANMWKQCLDQYEKDHFMFNVKELELLQQLVGDGMSNYDYDPEIEELYNKITNYLEPLE